MERFGRFVVKHRITIFILSLLLLIPSAVGYVKTKINYDILYYLPEEIETMQGQNILLDEFGTGAFSLCVVEGMPDKDIVKMKERMEQVPHVKKIIWYDTVADLSLPMELLPEDVKNFFNNEEKDATLMAVLFDTGTSEDETMDAIEGLRRAADGQCFVSGMSAIVTDTKNLANQETPVYVLIAVILAIVVLSLTMNSGLAPVFFLLSIGLAIVYNLGSNMMKGEISYVTQALAAVLQLGVTMDYSIFLWHSYEDNRKQCENDETAMARAIAATITSVVGSSVTTVAGFLALCFMSFTLGLDLGIVMAKGVVLGVICCVTVLPSMLLIFKRAVDKTRHKVIIPEFGKIGRFITKRYPVFLILFAVILIPAYYGQSHNDVYYDLAGTLPDELLSVTANHKLEEDFDMNATHMLLIDSSLSQKEAAGLIDEINQVDGVKAVLGIDSILGPAVPRDFIPEDLKGELMNENYQLMIISSEYAVASDEVNAQCDRINGIVKHYDPKGMLIGEAPCTKDLITITDQDFKVVNSVSIAAIFLIIAVVFKSISLPVILVCVIEFAIFINMGIPYYTHTQLPFIASIVIGTIQLGATVDYAILMTNKYQLARIQGVNKKEAVTGALEGSIQSVFVSALSFFAATFGVGMYSNIDMISSLCLLMARGALVSMVVVITVLPSMLMVFDGLICRTTWSMRGLKRREDMKNDRKKNGFRLISHKTLAGVLAVALVGGSIAGCGSAAAETVGQEEAPLANGQQETAANESEQPDSLLAALTENTNQSNEEKGKEETVYLFADSEGNVTSTIVSGWLKNPDKAEVLTDKTDLLEVFNVKGDETFEKNGDEYVWMADGKDIYYQGTTTKEAPVKVKITYYLNGEEISAKDLAGKSGKVKIRFDYENTQTAAAMVNGKEEEIYVPFAVVTGMILNDRFQNISVENGRLISDGKSNVVIGFALPGLKESLKLDDLDDLEDQKQDVEVPEYVEVSADVEDFALDMTLTVAASSADLSFDEALDFSDLDEKIETLTDASAQLKDGTNELADGILTLKDSMGEFSDGVSALKDGITEYTDGAARLGDGIAQVKDGADSLDSGAKELADGIQTLNGGTKELKSGIDSARNGAQQLAEGINGTAGAKSGAKQLADGAAAIKAGFDGVEGDPAQPGAVAASKQVSAGIKQFVAAVNAGTQEQMQAIRNQLLEKEILYVQQLYDAARLPVTVEEGNVRELAQNISGVANGIVGNIEQQAGQGINAVLAASAQAAAQTAADQVKDEAYLEGFLAGQQKGLAQTDVQEAEKQDLTKSEALENDQKESEDQAAENSGEGADGPTETENPAVGVSQEGAEAESNAGSSADNGPADNSSAAPASEEESDAESEGNADGSAENGTEDEAENAQSAEEDAALTAAARFSEAFGGKADVCTLQSGKQDKYGVIRLADGETGEESGGSSAQASAKVAEILKSASDNILTVGKAQGAIMAIEQLLSQLDQTGGSMTQEQLAQVQQLMDGADALTKGLEQLSAGADQLYAGASKLNAGMEQLGSGAKELTEGMGKLADGGSDLAEGAKKLQDGSSELKDGTQRLKDGAGELESGARELTDNSAALKDGASELAEGTGQVADGVEELYSGAGKLLDGMIEFDEDGIQKIADAYNGDVKSLTDRVRAVSDAGSAYDNFCGKQEDTKSSVKFIIRTEPVK